jgi:hypothetical protein
MDRISSIYGKPLIKGISDSPSRALQLMKGEILYRVRKKLLQSTFSDRAKKSFSKAISVQVGPSSLTIMSSHPAFAMMLRGQKKGQMTWLVKARRPIPIITETGELIFRTASARSMKNGKWIHPGRGPFDFVEKAKVEAKELIRQRVVKEIQAAASRAARGASR